MNRYLAGAAAAAAVVLTALAGWALFAPKTVRPTTPDATAHPAAEHFAQYGRALEREVKGMRYVDTAESLARPRQGYHVTFATTDPQLAKASDDVTNAARQTAWQRQFCTAELKARMDSDGVSIVTGRVIDGNGQTQYVADCLPGGVPQQKGPGGPLL